MKPEGSWHSEVKTGTVHFRTSLYCFTYVLFQSSLKPPCFICCCSRKSPWHTTYAPLLHRRTINSDTPIWISEHPSNVGLNLGNAKKPCWWQAAHVPLCASIPKKLRARRRQLTSGGTCSGSTGSASGGNVERGTRRELGTRVRATLLPLLHSGGRRRWWDTGRRSPREGEGRAPGRRWGAEADGGLLAARQAAWGSGVCGSGGSAGPRGQAGRSGWGQGGQCPPMIARDFLLMTPGGSAGWEKGAGWRTPPPLGGGSYQLPGWARLAPRNSQRNPNPAGWGFPAKKLQVNVQRNTKTIFGHF